MLNEKKIRMMTDLTKYEIGNGKEDLKISRFYRSDYLGLNLFKNFILSSIGYGVLLILGAIYYYEYLVENLNSINLWMFVTLLVGGYIMTLTVYSVVSYIIASLKYSSAKRRLKYYEQQLSILEKEGTLSPGAAQNEKRRRV